MLKSIALLMSLPALAGCGFYKSAYNDLSVEKCWGNVSDNVRLSGEVSVYYFPNMKTFASKDKCHPPTMGLVLNDDQKKYLNDLYKPQSGPNIIGIYAIFDLDGVAFSNKGSPDFLIRVTSLSIKPHSHLHKVEVPAN